MTVPLCTKHEVIKQVECQKIIMQDKLVVTTERVEVPKPVTVIKEVRPVCQCVKSLRVLRLSISIDYACTLSISDSFKWYLDV